jgi:hypothetical protein
MKNKIAFVLVSAISSLYAQKKNIIYRIAFDSYPVIGYSYNVNFLKLGEDNRYLFVEQKYISKRMVKKNIPFEILKEQGNWSIHKDTLKIVNDETKMESRFVIVDDKRIVFLFNNEDKSDYYWNKVDY